MRFDDGKFMNACYKIFMRLFFYMLIPLCMAGLLPNTAVQAAARNKKPSTTQLEQQLADIESELTTLARFSMRSGVGAVGFRSKDHPDPCHTEWIQIELGATESLDQIVLVPAIWRNPKSGFQAEGFPIEFQLLAGDAQTTNVVASFNAEDNLLPRVAPLAVSFPETPASWMRIEASLLSPRAWDGRHLLQLSEIMVFSGTENIALRNPVETSSIGEGPGRARKRESLVDGFVPYLMDAAQGEHSIAFMSPVGIGNRPTLTLDLGATLPLNRIHLHTPELSDTVPQSSEPGHGIPKRLLIEGANCPDFSDAVLLADYRMNTIFDSGPIIIRSFPETPCRYVRLTATAPFLIEGLPGRSQIGFAEIELFSNGKNVALNKPVRGNFNIYSGRPFSLLTDGHNLYGTILPIRVWMNELARRHDLETERPVVADKLHLRYERQKINLRRMIWLAALLAAGIAFTVLIDRMLRLKHVTAIRERFAADLHDELGANVHTIGLLGDVALKSLNAPERLKNVLTRSRELTERTGTAVRHCINLQEAHGLFESLPEDMRRAAQRIMADTEYDITIEGEVVLDKLKPGARADLFLFFKECLVNISRHADATQFNCRLVAGIKEIVLTICDNGKGMSDSAKNEVPSSLKRRARLLGATVSARQSESGGTCITLKFNPRRFRMRI
jgi:signal transduction histidine kinase